MCWFPYPHLNAFPGFLTRIGKGAVGTLERGTLLDDEVRIFCKFEGHVRTNDVGAGLEGQLPRNVHDRTIGKWVTDSGPCCVG